MAHVNAHRPPRAGMSPAAAYGLGVLGLLAVAAMFYGVYRSQFAAPPGYLFGTPTQPVEAGYCLIVAQDVIPSGAPIGSYVDEAAQFWIKRLRQLGADMGPAIAKARERLGRDLSASGGDSEIWLRNAMELCSNRAVMYGARFRAFD